MVVVTPYTIHHSLSPNVAAKLSWVSKLKQSVFVYHQRFLLTSNVMKETMYCLSRLDSFIVQFQWSFVHDIGINAYYDSNSNETIEYTEELNV